MKRETKPIELGSECMIKCAVVLASKSEISIANLCAPRLGSVEQVPSTRHEAHELFLPLLHVIGNVAAFFKMSSAGSRTRAKRGTGSLLVLSPGASPGATEAISILTAEHGRGRSRWLVASVMY